MDIRLALMAGIDIPIPDFQLTIHQPTIKEIALIGEDDFFTAIHYLTLKKEDYAVVADIADLNSFDLLMKIMQDSPEQVKDAIRGLLTLLFPSEQITFTPRSIFIINAQEQKTVVIDSNNFDILKQYINEIF